MRSATQESSAVGRRKPDFGGGVPCALCSTLAVLLIAGTKAAPANHADPARWFLASTLDLSQEDLDRVDRGEVVSASLEARDSREVATVGVVHLKVPASFYVRQFEDIARFKKGEAAVQVDAFSVPPSLDDVAGLTLDDGDLRALRSCSVGDCDVQLSADGIVRFQREVDWTRPDADEQANRLMRRILVDYVTGYLAAGASASMEYADRREEVSLEREFAALTESDLGGWQHFPQLRRHLLTYPAPSAPATRDRIYWSKEKVGRKTVVSVTHLAISRKPADSPAEYAIASKQIYGSHYFDSSLGLTVLLDDGTAATQCTYVAYVNRSRVDVFGGLLGPLKRRIVSSKARGTVSDQLARVQEKLERDFAVREGN
jgi:hypothetical protein